MPTNRPCCTGPALAAVLIATVGCGHGLYDVAPVSGTVTLYGEPLKNATVSFEPQAGSDQEIVGPGSSGQTDDSGRYKLTTFRGERGAVVGQHKVRISTYESRFKDLENSNEIEVLSIEHVPWQYNRNTILTFEVPSGGTSGADFDLTE